MNSLKPTNKVWVGATVGQMAAIAAWVGAEFWQVTVPPAIAMSMGGVIIAVVQWFVEDK